MRKKKYRRGACPPPPFDPACLKIGNLMGKGYGQRHIPRYNFIFVMGSFYVEERGNFKSRGVFRGGNFKQGGILCSIYVGSFPGENLFCWEFSGYRKPCMLVHVRLQTSRGIACVVNIETLITILKIHKKIQIYTF